MPDAIRIDRAAAMLDRSTRTLRRWIRYGAPDGTRIRVVARDQFTKYVYLDRSAIERVAAARTRSS